jgi:hypothetical protein
MSDITIEDKKVKTPKFRVSFPKLVKPEGYKGGEPKYSITMLFPKETDLSSLKKAALAAATEKWGEKAQAMIKAKKLKLPFRDGSAEKPDMQGYPGTIFVTASAKESNPPGCIDKDRERINPSELYAGCYARASLIAFAYDTGNKGVSFSLQNLQKLGDGKKFSGKKAAEEEFDAVEDQSDDPSSYADSDDEEDGDSLGF